MIDDMAEAEQPTGTRLHLEKKTAARSELHRDGWTDTLERLERSLS